MPYCTIDDVIEAAGTAEKLAQIADRGDDVTDEALVDKRIEEATGLIDAHLGRRYPLANVEVTPFLRRLAAKETYYLLLEDRRMLTQDDRDAHTERLVHLTAMRDNKIRTGRDPKPTPHDGAVSTARERGEGGRKDYEGL